MVDLLDVNRPIALLMVTALHFVSDDDDPAGILARYLAAMPENSVLVVSHTSGDHDDRDLSRQMTEALEMYQTSATPASPRTRAEIRELLAGVSLVAPGLVDVINWPDDTGSGSGTYGAVGYIPT